MVFEQLELFRVENIAQLTHALREVARWLELACGAQDRDPLWLTQRRALISLARSGAGLREEHQGVVRRAMDSANSAVRRAALAATGLQAPHHLPTPLETQSSPDASVVRWWRKVGPALRDLDGRFDLEPLVD